MILQVLDEEPDDELVDVVNIEGIDGSINVADHGSEASTVIMSDSDEEDTEIKNEEIITEERGELKDEKETANTKMDCENVVDPARLKINETVAENEKDDENITARVSTGLHVTLTENVDEKKMTAEEIIKILEGEDADDLNGPGMDERKTEERKMDEQGTDEQNMDERWMEEQKMDERRMEEQQIDEQRLDELTIDEQRLDELKIDEQRLDELKIEEQKIEEQKMNEQKMDDQEMDVQMDEDEGKMEGSVKPEGPIPDEENAVGTEKIDSPKKVGPPTDMSIPSDSLVWSLRNINEKDVWWPGTIKNTPEGSRVWYADSGTYADGPINVINVIIDIDTATISNIRRFFASLKSAVANNKIILGRYSQACLLYWPQRSKTVKALAKKFNIDLINK